MTHPSEDTLGWLLAQAARLHRFYLNEKLNEMGLFAGQEQVIQVLDSLGSIPMGELANILRVRAPTASKAVTRLTALGFVERQSERLAEGGDRRSVRVRLTRKGKTAAARIHALWDEVEADMVADFDPKDGKRLRKLLLRAATNLATALGGTEQNFDIPLDALDDHRI
ncbi:MarR family winged helix-turn-helix transcriptional regulator [Microvirga tunisiensis]|uniref:Winged helix-turn-helix transcriptional regulator n=1 Tax=Microvirga tunisiensis TaxID=2108360 RepID=A0A5N7MR57_9HYPH|nr:MarR family winged helix-turn-helix transcriptional regulator [Microvirga tunisiensis]MPR11475.1 winged helix-turn-helix transcriptional regulator [Microvirga tunisiensis]MPR29495.1 winged helix-turn-helix transcriptional regulator [Microvirga tunisiensis]